ncbi:MULTISPECIES: hypothetical protein [Bacillus]|uniref:Small peptidoglycan-associated lipoprotein n=2 Tax=Bacillus TaxID=1386 RepID=A0A0M3R970_9BACI|nr:MULTISPECIES: hypothetical protein [Bacillus]ALC80922.1 hypothetical protein AM592_04465 [Bacillus gobiensis]MBP1079867.1 hypothetical protein [Bacillus capparidis]MED1095256.1 hypothetical protein [Bacillus capparidis]
MPARIIFTMFALVFILGGCSITQGIPRQNDKIDELENEQLIFFSDEKNIEEEVVYYDAILDLKKHFPDQIGNMEVLKETDGWQNEVDTIPCLILVNNEKVVEKVEGSANEKDEIYNRFYDALEAAE